MPQTFARTQTGLREDLNDGIYNIDAKATPMLSVAPKGKTPTNPLFSWQADAYDAARTDGVVDGTDVSTTEDAAENRARLYGRVQKLRRTPKVSDFTEFTDVAGQGVGREFAEALVKKVKELKRDAEKTISSDNDSQEDNGTLPYLTRGFGKWAQSTAQTDLPVPAAFRTPAASIDTTAMASLTTAIINTVMQSQYDQTGEVKNYLLVAGQTLKKTITNIVGYQPTVSNFTAILRTNRGDEGMWENNIQTFTGDFGTYDIVVSNFLPTVYRGYAFDPKSLELRMYKPWSVKELPDMGGGRRALIEVVMGLMVKNPLGIAKFAGTS